MKVRIFIGFLSIFLFLTLGLSGDDSEKIHKAVVPQKLGQKEFAELDSGFETIDFRKIANREFKDKKAGDNKGGWTDQGKNDLRSMKPGLQKFKWIEFDIIDPASNNGKSCIVMQGQNFPNLPKNVIIPVNKKFKGIYFLQASAWSYGKVADYIVEYSDGEKITVPVRDGVEVCDWWGAKNCNSCFPGWWGKNPSRAGVGLSTFPWVNPLPDKKIKSVTVKTDGDKSLLMLVAATGTTKAPPAMLTGSFHETDKKDWWAWDAAKAADWAGTDLDVSKILEIPKPTEKNSAGYNVLVHKENFVNSDGERLRFWGLNISAGANFPDHKTADKMISQLKAMGANMVRFHHLEAPWISKNIFDETTTRKLDTESLDRLDYLVSKCEEAGFYIYWDCLVSRVLKDKDGIEYYQDAGFGLKPGGMFMPRLIAVQKEFNRQILLRKNKYTGRKLIDSPYLAGAEIINECCLMYSNGDEIKGDAIRGKFKELWNQWLRNNYPTLEDLRKAWGANGLKEGEDHIAGNIEPVMGWLNAALYSDLSDERIKDSWLFFHEVQDTYKFLIYRDLRSIDLRCPIAGSNHWAAWPIDLYSDSRMDFIDRHAYFAHPEGGYGIQKGVHFNPGSMITQGASVNSNIIAMLANRRIAQMPFIITEWNSSAPNTYICEVPLIFGAYCCFQNWDAIQFSYSHIDKIWPEKTGSNFDVAENPVHLALWPAVSIMVRRGDIDEAEKSITAEYSQEELLNPKVKLNKISPAEAITKKTSVKFVEKLSNPQASQKDSEQTVFKTKQLMWDTEKRLFTVDSPGTQGASGNLSRKIELSDVTIQVKNKIACVIITSLTDDEIEDSGKILVTAVSRSENTGQKWPDSPLKNRVQAPGTEPVLVEPVEGYIELNEDDPVKVWLIGYDGKRIKEIPAEIKDDKTIIKFKTIGGNHLVIERE